MKTQEKSLLGSILFMYVALCPVVGYAYLNASHQRHQYPPLVQVALVSAIWPALLLIASAETAVDLDIRRGEQ